MFCWQRIQTVRMIVCVFSDRAVTVWTGDDFGGFAVAASSLSAAAEEDVSFLSSGPGSWLGLMQEVLHYSESTTASTASTRGVNWWTCWIVYYLH